MTPSCGRRRRESITSEVRAQTIRGWAQIRPGSVVTAWWHHTPPPVRTTAGWCPPPGSGGGLGVSSIPAVLVAHAYWSPGRGFCFWAEDGRLVGRGRRGEDEELGPRRHSF